MNSTTINKNFWFYAFLSLSLLFIGCKNQQKLAEEEAAKVKAENIAEAKAILNSILDDDGQMTLVEKERKLRQAKVMNSDDPEVLQLISQVEEMIAREKEAERMSREVQKPDADLNDQLIELFDKIANAPNAESANNLIENGLDLFNSPEALVLIIVSKSGDLKDYDQPTNIERYLHYIKDHKILSNVVYNIVTDDQGKISEVELIKKSIK
jgi:hypothetical protein